VQAKTQYFYPVITITLNKAENKEKLIKGLRATTSAEIINSDGSDIKLAIKTESTINKELVRCRSGTLLKIILALLLIPKPYYHFEMDEINQDKKYDIKPDNHSLTEIATETAEIRMKALNILQVYINDQKKLPSTKEIDKQISIIKEELYGTKGTEKAKDLFREFCNYFSMRPR
jgi:hypothetical protein